ncbi:hypothetical protein [Paenibacillus chitinolyticus]|uniref:hypothetical protein n=1 Tax=Paenibacillus TaxID=44249 RepID=UPI001C4935A1|nr:hypothetical protein [Paenibacillus chitinolyticus]MBV6714434.1 hypothetical protein [Paenibacillus chitinolyticus]
MTTPNESGDQPIEAQATEEEQLSPEEQAAKEQQEQQQQNEIIFAWYKHAEQVLKEQFSDYEVEGQVGQHPVFGPLFAYTVRQNDNSYSCGFFLNELVHTFQNKENPGLWMSSFFVDLIRSSDNRPLPAAPQSEEEAKELLDKYIVPHCAESVRSEFPEEQIYVDLEMHPEAGPVLEVGFPSIKEGNNTFALPLQFLMTLHLLNRDPADPLVQALYKIHEEHQQQAEHT